MRKAPSKVLFHTTSTAYFLHFPPDNRWRCRRWRGRADRHFLARVSPAPIVAFVEDDAVTGVPERELLADRVGTFLSVTEAGFPERPQQTWW